MDRLLQRIRNGEWGPGDQLPSERELMETYGVGRPAIREAQQDLARSGILEIAHGERARVALPTADDLINQIGRCKAFAAHAAQYAGSRKRGAHIS